MSRILILYYSRSGNTEEMARLIGKGIVEEGLEAHVMDIDEAEPSAMLEFQGIIIGSPTYYGASAYQVKDLLDRSVVYHGKLEGKVGGAFTSSANLAGGNETTIMGILQMFMVHGMVLMGDPKGSHYGPVSVGKPDERAREECLRYGRRMAALVKKFF